MNQLTTIRRTAAFVLGALLATAAAAQGMQDVEIRAEKVRGNVYVLYGQGGNIGLSIGDDGAFMIDDQFAPLTPKILDAVASLTDHPVKFVVNTHWHFDHTGGNENMGERGAIIVAHENVRKTMSTEQFIEAFNRTQPAAPEKALPVVTFADSIDFHWNDEHMHVFHVGPAHTNGDSVIHFENANVFHMGDIYFSNGYPFIDTGRGGNLGGFIDAVDTVLEKANARTRFIPGHGNVTGIDDLREYRDMLETIHGRIEKLVEEGKSREEVIAAKPTADFDDQWGGGFMQPEQWVGIVYDGFANEAGEE